MRTQAEIENILVEIEKREQKATPGPLDRSGYCELDGAIHVGTIGLRGKTGINFTDLSSCDRLILDVTCLGNDDLEAIANAKFYAHARTDIPTLISLVRELMQLKWISVKEMEPPYDDEILTATFDDSGKRLVKSDWYMDNGQWESGDEEVTHWMPRPESPQEEDKQ